jgi:glutathione S-transferase
MAVSPAHSRTLALQTYDRVFSSKNLLSGKSGRITSTYVVKKGNIRATLPFGIRPMLSLSVDINFASPYALSVYVALCEKGLPFQTQVIDLAAGEHLEDSFARSSLTARVPTLTDQGFTLSESSAMDEYLDEAYPAPEYPRLYPSDMRDRARARQLQAWIRSDLMPIREERSTATLFLGEKAQPLTEKALKASARLVGVMDALLSEESEHLFGAWCIADTDMAIMLGRLVRNGDSVPEKLIRYTHRQWQRPSVVRWVNQKRPG